MEIGVELVIHVDKWDSYALELYGKHSYNISEQIRGGKEPVFAVNVDAISNLVYRS